jgi:hypothetical protein
VPSARWLSGGGHQSLDPLVALGYAAAATRRLRLLTKPRRRALSQFVPAGQGRGDRRQAVRGRLILGLGAEYQKSEFLALGIDFDECNALFDTGRHFSARDVVARPKPAQNPTPIWIGGNSRLSRRHDKTKGERPVNTTQARMNRPLSRKFTP